VQLAVSELIASMRLGFRQCVGRHSPRGSRTLSCIFRRSAP